MVVMAGWAACFTNANSTVMPPFWNAMMGANVPAAAAAGCGGGVVMPPRRSKTSAADAAAAAGCAAGVGVRSRRPPSGSATSEGPATQRIVLVTRYITRSGAIRIAFSSQSRNENVQAGKLPQNSQVEVVAPFAHKCASLRIQNAPQLLMVPCTQTHHSSVHPTPPSSNSPAPRSPPSKSTKSLAAPPAAAAWLLGPALGPLPSSAAPPACSGTSSGGMCSSSWGRRWSSRKMALYSQARACTSSSPLPMCRCMRDLRGCKEGLCWGERCGRRINWTTKKQKPDGKSGRKKYDSGPQLAYKCRNLSYLWRQDVVQGVFCGLLPTKDTADAHWPSVPQSVTIQINSHLRRAVWPGMRVVSFMAEVST